MSYANIPDTGLLLDATPWAGPPFAEGETLHFKPAARRRRPMADFFFGLPVVLVQALKGPR
jgi:hypothetical protein